MTTGADFVAAVEAQIGKPYQLGGVGPSVFDCSGLVQTAAAKVGLKLPRVSSEQFSAGTPVNSADLQPGDLVFSEWPGDDVPHHGHVAVYAGGGMIVEAPHPGGVVQKVALDSNYLSHVDGYVRPAGLAASGAAAGTASNVSDTSGGTSPWGAALGQLLGGPAGAAEGINGTGVTGQLGGVLSAVYDSLVAALSFFSAFFRPSTYIRIGAGVFGGVFIIVGLVFLGREARQA